MYADLHCHPGAAAYDSARLAVGGKDSTPFDPWHIPQSNLISQSQGKHSFQYSQCDLAKSVTARAKLLFTALHPVEKGYFSGLTGGRFGKKKIAEFFRRVHGDGEVPAFDWIFNELRSQPGMQSIERSSLDFIRSLPLAYPLERILHVQNEQYDYFDELKREYKFYRNMAGCTGTTAQPLQLYPEGQKKNWSGRYNLAKSGEELHTTFNPLDEDIAMVITVDGIHSLGIGNPESETFKSGQLSTDVTVGRIKSRIRQLKGEEPLEDDELSYWEHRPFYLTFAHHFNNSLCGHARSFPNASRVILDQRKNMDKGILKQATFEVIHELLGLDEDLSPTGSKRILLDIKHMSAAARSDFYKYVLRPFNYKSSNKESRIPVVASHVGYSGIDRLEVQVRNSFLEREDDRFKIGNFFGWSINLTDEDVIEIHNSKGLLGLSFDRRLLGEQESSWIGKLPLKSTQRRQAMNPIARTIEQFVRIPFAYHLDEPLRIWDTLCLGTGFDGSMDPINRYATVLQFKTFEEDLVDILERLKKEEPLWFGSYHPESLARKICFENAYGFVIKHY